MEGRHSPAQWRDRRKDSGLVSGPSTEGFFNRYLKMGYRGKGGTNRGFVIFARK